jgi:hypothetical protein
MGRRRAREARPKAPARVRGQRELRHEQQRSADVPHGPIHFAGRVGKHAVRDQPRGELHGLILAVLPLDPNQNEQALPNFSEFFALRSNGRPTDALD